MYLKSIHSVNVGPIEDAKIIFPFNEDGTPKPVVIVGENGTGKSVLLSNIVDSFYEIAGVAFSDVREKDSFSRGDLYYKAVLPQEIKIGKQYMYSYLEYFDNVINDFYIKYVLKSGHLSTQDFFKIENIQSNNKFNWEYEDNYKNTIVDKKKVEKILSEEILCYFSPERYEKPNWMGNRYYELSNFEHLTIKEKWSGRLNKPILVTNVNVQTLQWLLDVIVDSRCDVEKSGEDLNIVHVGTNELLALGLARKNVEKIMSTILDVDVYFGLNYRNVGKSRFNINSLSDNNVFIPTLDALSTGQSALFNMFATIIRYADSNDINKSINLEDITGIVVIDEIELHLHSNLQREVLPKLLKLFPKVQFIISSHSPLFLLGMDEEYKSDGYEIYEMSSAIKITSERFSEFTKAYKYLSETETHQKEIREVIQKHQDKPLIITEGATDWKHMKAAFENLKTKEKYKNFANISFEFLEYEPSNKNEDKKISENSILKLEMGDKTLESLCKYFSSFKQSRKIIFIADSDVKEICDNLGNENFPKYKDWGNNVFSFVLPLPEHRQNTPEICIEHYYTDEEIKTLVTLEGGSKRRLYMGNEFQKNGISIENKLICNKKDSCGEESIKIIDGSSKGKVYSFDDKEAKNNLALSKMEFAKGILGKKAEFTNINFDNFHLIFDLIKQIIERPAVENGSEEFC